ncbi:hypothetical protein UA08_04037 [Talaromyces atroroseus]|uniref:Uncharacterized protein n=1 Tax=Talaromyces atroroseus TaxID=1441469 RepID=A0A1Q5Q8D7_TALAT|nr:hypothetical protein UA08_04037 [Talaromyces atroroseus]OKL60393.1 hypothetical protein UA08_04037 [Talaromyces atroroseus]
MAKAANRSGKGKQKSAAKPPTPFVKAPSTLQSFLESLDPNEVYLIHIDKETPDLKKQLFLLPILLNTAIALGIAYRVYHASYVYPEIIAIALGLKEPAVQLTSFPLPTATSMVLRRTLMFAFDYFLVTFFAGWPIRFILGPIYWRRKVGFRPREVVVRQSRTFWSSNLERNRWIYEDEKVIGEVITPAIAPQRVMKSGYLLIDANWDLDYKTMVRAHGLVDLTSKGRGVQLDEFRTAVLVNTDEDGWLIWRVADEGTKERGQQRDQLLAFQEKLASMGKEDLFFRWVELVQYESTQAGGFTPERQRRAMLQAKEMFEAEGVNFSQFWQAVGGMQGNIDLD